MSPSEQLKEKSALIVGLGGLGCPAALALAQAGIGRLILCDDDRVEESNLHRQILFGQDDVGRDKLQVGQRALLGYGAANVELIRSRLLPENALSLVRETDVVLEGADNFPTKFLAADACLLTQTPIIHGAAIRLVGTAMSVSSSGTPCYRCLFEDLLPAELTPNCDGAGVLGPVPGVIGALMADLALDVLLGDTSRQGSIFTFDAQRMKIRQVSVNPRESCQLCAAPLASNHHRSLDLSRDAYQPPSSCPNV